MHVRLHLFLVLLALQNLIIRCSITTHQAFVVFPHHPLFGFGSAGVPGVGPVRQAVAGRLVPGAAGRAQRRLAAAKPQGGRSRGGVAVPAWGPPAGLRGARLAQRRPSRRQPSLTRCSSGVARLPLLLWTGPQR